MILLKKKGEKCVNRYSTFFFRHIRVRLMSLQFIFDSKNRSVNSRSLVIYLLISTVTQRYSQNSREHQHENQIA